MTPPESVKAKEPYIVVEKQMLETCMLRRSTANVQK